MSVGVFCDAAATLGEGPCWDPALDALVWVDILERQVLVSTREATRSYATPATVGAAVPRAGGGLLLATGCGFATLDLDDGAVAPVATVPGDPELIRMNDGKADPAGRLWAGTMAFDETPDQGALYRLDGREAVTQMIAPVSVSNGLGWSLDAAWMYFVDSPTCTIVRFAFDVATGELGEQSVLADTSPLSGVPDGLAVDAAGDLWVAFWDGWAVRCFSGADGSLREELPVPVARPTSCAFGGDDLAELLVTSARDGLGPRELADQPLAGAVLALDPGVSGLPPTPAVLEEP